MLSLVPSLFLERVLCTTVVDFRALYYWRHTSYTSVESKSSMNQRYKEIGLHVPAVCVAEKRRRRILSIVGLVVEIGFLFVNSSFRYFLS